MKAIIVSLKTEKAIVVRVARIFSHPRYGKTVKRHRNFHVSLLPSIDFSKLRLGQSVEIAPAAPRSALKRFLLTQIYD